MPEAFTEEVKVNHQIANPKFSPAEHPGGPPASLTYTRIVLTADPAHVVAGGNGGNGRITVTAKDDQPMAELIAGDKEAVIAAGQKGARPGRLTLYDGSGQPALNLTSSNGAISVRDASAKEMFLFSPDPVAGTAGLMVGVYKPAGGRPGWIAIRNQTGADAIYLGGKEGQIAVRNETGNDTILLDGQKGDVVFQNADCAEEFELAAGETVEAGSVVVLDVEGRLIECKQPYDRSVAGVVSGAGECRPAMLLDRKTHQGDRFPVALVGKVYCKVDAGLAKIVVGDLLTTSATPGHAMKATDPLRAFGSVLGKALRPLEAGTGLIPILVALQ